MAGRQGKHEKFGQELRRLLTRTGVKPKQIYAASMKPGRRTLATSTLSNWLNGQSLPSSARSLDTFLTAVAEVSGKPFPPGERENWHNALAAAKAHKDVGASSGNGTDAPEFLVSSMEPVLLGVHRARRHEGCAPVPPYVPRDADARLDAALRIACERSGLVLIRGDSTAGKTRSAYEAAKRLMPEFRLLHPSGTGPLDGHVDTVAAEWARGRQCVIWLDNLEQYLGPDGITLPLLGRLAPYRTVVLATMRLSEYKNRTSQVTRPGRSDSGYAQVDLRDPVLQAAEIVDLPRAWSAEEIGRASRDSDPRLAEALRHSERYGVAEYLSAGPKLWDTWHNARFVGGNPRGNALVAAAIDLHRAGLTSPIGMNLIKALHEHYLEGEESAALEPESYPAAVTWATAPRLGITRLLIPAGTDTWRPFDYLVDTLAKNPASPAVPSLVHEAAVEHAKSPQEQHSVGVAAWRAGLSSLAARAFRPAAEAGHTDSMLHLGSILLDQKEEGKAERWWLAAAENGSPRGMLNMGVRCSKTGRNKKAEKWWRAALNAGFLPAAAKLAAVHEDRGDTEEGERLWNLALEADVPDAHFRFGLLAYRRQDWNTAERHYLQAARQRHIEATTNLAQVYFAQDRIEEATKLYAIAAEAGDAVAMRSMGILSEWQGRFLPEEMSQEEAMRRMAETMEKYFAGQAVEEEWPASAKAARDWYKRAGDNGDVMSVRLLGNLYHRRGRAKKAHKCYRQAAKLGDPESAAYFQMPTLAYASTVSDAYWEPEEEDFDEDAAPLSPRTVRMLKVALEIQADEARMALKDLGDRHITHDDWFQPLFGSLPAQTWELDREWRRHMVEACDALVAQIGGTGVPKPRCTGEEMALHLALEKAAALTDDDHELVEEFTQGLETRADDYDWHMCKDILFEDHDVLMLYEPWNEGIERQGHPLISAMGLTNLDPRDWFIPFRGSVEDEAGDVPEEDPDPEGFPGDPY
ncbi:tetratricopeptide repeat protein [Streptomyces sp. NPDC094032]|uniref:tetratricopeptide repeat protein n=1 Tax=Streptomyces sp. NPDC094032 TaxID=3155308 RepID=UPI003322D601